MHLYLPLIRTGTSATYDRGKDAWSSDDHILQDVNPITKTVKFYKSLANPESRKVREMTGLKPEDTGEALGKPRGFAQRDVGAKSP